MPTSTLSATHQLQALQGYIRTRLDQDRRKDESAEAHFKRIAGDLLVGSQRDLGLVFLGQLIAYTQRDSIRDLYWDEIWDDASSQLRAGAQSGWQQIRNLRPIEEILELHCFEDRHFSLLCFIIMGREAYEEDAGNLFVSNHPNALWLRGLGFALGE